MSLPPRNRRLIDLERLKALIGSGSVDTVVIAFTDMQGRLQGKRLHGQYFVDIVVGHGTPRRSVVQLPARGRLAEVVAR